jgi:hypothetical protein
MIALSESTGTLATRKVEKKVEELEDSRGEMISGQNKTFRDQGKYHFLKVIEKGSLHRDKEVEIIKLKDMIETESISKQKAVDLMETIEMGEMKEIAVMSKARIDIEKKKLDILTKVEQI